MGLRTPPWTFYNLVRKAQDLMAVSTRMKNNRWMGLFWGKMHTRGQHTISTGVCTL